MGGYEAKVRKIDRKVTFFLSKAFICYVYIAKPCGNVLQNTPTFANSISLSDFLFWPSLSVFLNFRWCSAEGAIIHSSHCGKLPPRAHVRAPYSNFALFAFTTFTLSPFICLDFPLISRHHPPKISHVFSKNSDVFGEISHVFSKTSQSCG